MNDEEIRSLITSSGNAFGGRVTKGSCELLLGMFKALLKLEEPCHTEYQVPYSADGNYCVPDHVGDVAKIVKDAINEQAADDGLPF